MKPNRIAFEELYSDESGVEFAVRCINDRIEIHGGTVTAEFPLDKLTWLIERLHYIQEEAAQSSPEKENKE